MAISSMPQDPNGCFSTEQAHKNLSSPWDSLNNFKCQLLFLQTSTLDLKKRHALVNPRSMTELLQEVSFSFVSVQSLTT